MHKIGLQHVADVVCRGETRGSAEVGSPLGLYLSRCYLLKRSHATNNVLSSCNVSAVSSSQGVFKIQSTE